MGVIEDKFVGNGPEKLRGIQPECLYFQDEIKDNVVCKSESCLKRLLKWGFKEVVENLEQSSRHEAVWCGG